MIDWSKFILEGFGSEKEKLAADQELLRYGPTYKAKDDELEVKWYKKNGLKYFTVVCRCGNNRMIMHDNGIRCHICGRFHSHENFNRHRLQARKLSKFNDGKVPVKPQPFYEAMGIQRGRPGSSKGTAVFNRDGLARVGVSTGKSNPS